MIRDLRVYAAANHAQVFHWRTSDGEEFDAVVERRDGTWTPVEVKLGTARVDQAAGSLTKSCEAIDVGERGEPVAKLVTTSTGYSYQGPDGAPQPPSPASSPETVTGKCGLCPVAPYVSCLSLGIAWRFRRWSVDRGRGVSGFGRRRRSDCDGPARYAALPCLLRTRFISVIWLDGSVPLGRWRVWRARLSRCLPPGPCQRNPPTRRCRLSRGGRARVRCRSLWVRMRRRSRTSMRRRCWLV